MVKDKKPTESSTTVNKIAKKTKKLSAAKLFTPFIALGRYFKGSWMELRQVRWPDRKATLGLTAAVLFFSGFFVLIIVLLDAGFTELFNLIIK